MKKTQIQEILNLSSLTMVDPEYTIFTKYILSGRYTDARIFISDFIDIKSFERTADDTESFESYADYCDRCDRLENLVLDLVINNEDVKHDYKPRRKRVRRSIVQ